MHKTQYIWCLILRWNLRANDFLKVYQEDSLVCNLAEGIRTFKPEAIHVKGLHGSLDAVLFAATFKASKSSHVIVLQDREEASYFLNDLQSLLGEKDVLFFPMSYKRPYEYDETENANILMRAEVLSQVSNHPDSQIIVTYPEALSEKVINKKSLSSNTFVVRVGETLDRAFLEEFLHTYDFERPTLFMRPVSLPSVVEFWTYFLLPMTFLIALSCLAMRLTAFARSILAHNFLLRPMKR